jgi:hypothetical protein
MGIRQAGSLFYTWLWSWGSSPFTLHIGWEQVVQPEERPGNPAVLFNDGRSDVLACLLWGFNLKHQGFQFQAKKRFRITSGDYGCCAQAP